MKHIRHLYLLAVLMIIPIALKGQDSVIKESLTVDSEILGKEVEYSIYLPEGYEESSRSYPVLYLLHGFSDDETGWVQFGEVQAITDRAVKEIAVTPMIIAMPDAGVSWYVNNHDGSLRYEDFFIEEFIPAIEEKYRIRSEKQFRAVAGLSMGGHGSLIYAMKHPDLFSSAAPLSAGVSLDASITEMPMDSWNHVYSTPFGEGREGEERLTEHYRENSVLNLVKSLDPKKLSTVRYYIDCGDDDFLIKGNMELHAAMLDREIPHEFRVRDGGHTWTYWRTALPEVLKFVSQGFHR